MQRCGGGADAGFASTIAGFFHLFKGSHEPAI